MGPAPVTGGMALGPVPVTVCGALGRMGQRVVVAVVANAALALAGAAERADNPSLGLDVGPICGLRPTGILATGDFAEASKNSRVYIDFTNPAAVLSHLDTARRLGLSAVIGATGFDAGERERLIAYSKSVPVLWAPNMSLGVSLMYKVAKLMAESLGPDFDIEIIEAHHRLKKDAPSGTAARLQEVLAEARGLDPAQSLVSGRQGLVGERRPGEIGVLAVRGGDVVGDHSVMFLGTGERLELVHRATSRDVFAAGAVRAAVWIADKKPGLYSLSDVLGL
ncbi:MAG: 4-hydroxy-tetrahydrodipicolinate reductase [Deltaproteobacteria bacterium]|nr:4-hydroxy-tetrahydrodipicolinate reductase [Deltaproteobacteria bacterium]